MPSKEYTGTKKLVNISVLEVKSSKQEKNHAGFSVRGISCFFGSKGKKKEFALGQRKGSCKCSKRLKGKDFGKSKNY